MARWLLAIAVVLTLSPSSFVADGVVRAQDRLQDDDPGVGRVLADDDTTPEHATPDDSAPAAPAQERPPATRPLFEPSIHPAAGSQTAPADDETPARTQAEPAPVAMPDDQTPPAAAESPSPAAGNRRVAYPRPDNQAAAACPAELGPAKAATFGANDRLVMTYYYYWYDEASLEDPALAQRPPADPALDWRSVAWHERQLADMASAGIDVALAVYWGDTATWSLDGLEAMVEARERLLAAGLRPPAIGLFFDTNMYAMILPEAPQLNDLTTQDGLDMLAYQIGGFLDRVPPCHRARVDGRPLAFFWRADTEDGDRFIFDDRTFDSLTDLVVSEYGERLHLAVERSWLDAARQANVELGAMDVYRWGAALNGPRFEGRTVAVGPGYDDTRIDGRPGYTRERVDGGTYSRDLRQAVMSGTTWLLLETWNELWEGTAIAETEETGRTYLGITARYSALFHQLGRERARDGWFDLGTGYNAYLRRLADAPIEQGEPAEQLSRRGASPFPEDDGTGYFHFSIDRRLQLNDPRPLTVLVEYFDEGEGSFVLEYDSVDPVPASPATTATARNSPDRQASGQGASASAPARAASSHTPADGSLAPDLGDDGRSASSAAPEPDGAEDESLVTRRAIRILAGEADEGVAASPAGLIPDDGQDENPATAPETEALPAPIDPVYRRTEPVFFENTRTWRTRRFDLPDASLRHRQYDGVGDFRLHDRPGSDGRLHTFGRVTVTAEPASRPVPYEPESLTFVDPGPKEVVTLRWSEADPAPGYLVVVQPLEIEDDTDLHGFTTDDRQRCVGEAPVEAGNESRGLTRRSTCELRLAPDLAEGVYRWRVQALNADGVGVGQTSDWAYFVLARR